MNFSREITNVLNLGLDIYNCIICLFIIGSIGNSIKNNKSHKSFFYICLALLIFNISDMSNWCCEGTDYLWKIPALHILTFTYYASIPFTFVALVIYTSDYLKPRKINKKFFYFFLGIISIYLIGVLISPFTGFYYYISPDNYYHRGKYNFVSFGFFIFLYILVTILIFLNRKYFSTKEFHAFLSFPFLPIVMEIIQINFYGVALVNVGMTLSILLLFMTLHSNLESSYQLKENEAKTTEEKLINFQEHTIISLSNLVENRDTETGEHARRTSLFVELLARKTMLDGYYTETINDAYIKRLVKAAPMHDIGKIVVSDTVLKKNGRLDSSEYEQIKEHALEGGRIVNDIIGLTDDKEYIQIAIDMAQSHHERWDGTGYPNMLANDQIPLSARLMAIADVFDALVFERCYKKAVPADEAFEIIKSEAGTHFDPILVSEFILLKDEIARIVHIYKD